MRSSPLKQVELKRLAALPFAHRGLHGNGRVENSRAAFLAAIAHGHGIELDVQPSRDGFAFVFHDAMLDRLTDASGPVAERGPADLRNVRLTGTDENVPHLPEILALVAGRVPLLIELKTPGSNHRPLCCHVAAALAGYSGPAGVMSFDPRVSRWFKRLFPNALRGLVMSEAEGSSLRQRSKRRLAFWWAEPDFIAYDIRDLPSAFVARARARGVPAFTWTCRSADDEARARLHADQIIHELAPTAHPE